jgi:hypothetical protein
MLEMTSLQGSKTVQVKLILCFSFCMIAQFWASAAHAEVLSIPPNTSETTQVGASRFADWIYAGSRGFSALEQIGISPGVVLATGLPPDARVQSELRESLFRVRTAASLATTVEIEVIKAWVQPPPLVPLPNDLSNGLYYEGRAIDFVIKDPAGMATVDTVFTLLGASTDFKTNYLQLVDAAGPVPKHIHMSIAKAESRKLAVSVGDVVSGSDSDGLSKSYWDGVKNSGESDLIDEFISQFRGTASASAAFSERYTALRKSSNDFFTKYPQKYAELTSTQQAESLPKYSLIVADYHQFLSAHTGTVGAYVGLTDLLRLRRWENNPIGYLDFIKRFPASAESQIAMECLYQVETELLVSGQGSPRFADYDFFLKSYPNAAQWPLIAELAILQSLADDEILRKSDNSPEINLWRSKAYLGAALEAYQSLRASRAETAGKDNSIGSPMYLQAKYDYWQIDRIERILGTRYRSSISNSRLLHIGLAWSTANKIGDAVIQLRLLQKQLIQQNGELVGVIQVESRKTREAIVSGVKHVLTTIDSEFSKLENELEQQFASVHREFEALHNDLVVVIEQTRELVGEQKGVRDGLRVSQEKLLGTNERLERLLESQRRIVEIVDRMATRNVTLPGSGLLGYVASRADTLVNSVSAELSRLSVDSITDAVRNPRKAAQEALKRGDKSLRTECGRAVADLKKTDVYKRVQAWIVAAGEELLMEKPRGFIECKPNGVPVSGLPDLYFVNGIWTSPEEAQEEGIALANQLSRTVYVLYNPTAMLGNDPVNGMYEDVEEATLDRIWPITLLNVSLGELLNSGTLQHNQTTRQLSYLFHHATGRIDIVCHSQGTLICRNALLTCEFFGDSLNDIHVVFTGPPLGDDEVLSKPGKYEAKRNSGDPVVDTLGFQSILREQNVTKHSFIGNYDVKISASDF